MTIHEAIFSLRRGMMFPFSVGTSARLSLS